MKNLIHGIFDYYLIVYVDKNGNQVLKPFDDNENGNLRQIAMMRVYQKQH